MTTARETILSWKAGKADHLEFDDVDASHPPWVISKKARQAMGALANEFGLGLTANPGGAEFNGRVNGKSFRCQIHDGDDVEALWQLRRAIARAFEGETER